MFKRERGITLLEVMSIIVILSLVTTAGVGNYLSEINKARITTDIYQGRIIKDAIDLYAINLGHSPTSVRDLREYISQVKSAQLIDGSPIVLNDENLGKPVFDINLRKGEVKVFDISLNEVVWESD